MQYSKDGLKIIFPNTKAFHSVKYLIKKLLSPLLSSLPRETTAGCHFKIREKILERELKLSIACVKIQSRLRRESRPLTNLISHSKWSVVSPHLLNLHSLAHHNAKPCLPSCAAPLYVSLCTPRVVAVIPDPRAARSLRFSPSENGRRISSVKPRAPSSDFKSWGFASNEGLTTSDNVSLRLLF